jgi:ElaB/YqjD/DUF883 family membrane-anchored ribosome-binding protein
MGQRTDQAERDVASQREFISKRLEELNSQVGRGMDQAGDRLREQVSSVRQQVADTADRVPGKRALEETVPAHPLTSVLGGFGLGVALGMLRVPGEGDSSEGARSHNGHTSNGNGRHDSRDDGNGFVDKLSGIAIGSLTGPLQHRLADLAEEAVAGFMGRGSNGSGQRRDGRQ